MVAAQNLGPLNLGIITPEAVVLELEPAGVATRALAKLLDVALQATAIFAGVFAIAFALSGSWRSISMGIWAVFVLLLLPGVVEALWSGVTPGKKALGLRVVTTDGGPASVLAYMTRSVLQIVDVYLGFGIVAMLLSRRSQRFGDLLGGTFVLDERIDSTGAIPIAFLPPPGTEAWIASADVARVSAAHYQLIRSFLLRVGELDASARTVLATEIADRTRLLVTPEPWPWFTAELYINCVASAYQVRNGGLPVAPSVGPGVGNVAGWSTAGGRSTSWDSR